MTAGNSCRLAAPPRNPGSARTSSLQFWTSEMTTVPSRLIQPVTSALLRSQFCVYCVREVPQLTAAHTSALRPLMFNSYGLKPRFGGLAASASSQAARLAAKPCLNTVLRTPIRTSSHAHRSGAWPRASNARLNNVVHGRDRGKEHVSCSVTLRLLAVLGVLCGSDLAVASFRSSACIDALTAPKHVSVEANIRALRTAAPVGNAVSHAVCLAASTQAWPGGGVSAPWREATTQSLLGQRSSCGAGRSVTHLTSCGTAPRLLTKPQHVRGVAHVSSGMPTGHHHDVQEQARSSFVYEVITLTTLLASSLFLCAPSCSLQHCTLSLIWSRRNLPTIADVFYIAFAIAAPDFRSLASGLLRVRSDVL